MSEQRKQEIKEKLAGTRLQFRTLLMRLNAEQWEVEVYHGDEPWTVIQLVRHVVDAERGLMTNVERIRDGGEGVPPDFDRERWNRSRQKRMAGKGPKDLLAEMAQNRAALLEIVDTLGDEDWEKTGRHASLRIMTIEQFLHQIADHEAGHAADIAGAVGLSIASRNE
jgi:hypothetical protein